MTLPDPDNRGVYPRWFAAWRAVCMFTKTAVVRREPREAMPKARWVYHAWRKPIELADPLERIG